MKLFFALLLAAFSSQCVAQTIINDKNAVVRNTGSFSGIRASGGIDIYLSQGDEYAVAVSASDENYRDNIKTEVKNGILNIYYDGSSLRLTGNRKLRAYVSFRSLESLEASGACDFIINGNLKCEDLKIKLSGASDLKGLLTITNLSVDMSGASDIKAEGEVKNLKLDASGASDFKNYQLQVTHCVAYISGASDVRLSVSGSIMAKASGASTLYYSGNPEKKEVHSSGASSVSQRNN